jgi:hypothetical protein
MPHRQSAVKSYRTLAVEDLFGGKNIMPHGPPSLIAIDHDDYHAEHVGRTADGRQFFLTTPFEPAIGGKAGCEYVALLFFDSAGKFLEAKIESFGPRASLDEAKRRGLYEEWLSELGHVSFERIEVAPFSAQFLAWCLVHRRKMVKNGGLSYSLGITWPFTSPGIAESMIPEPNKPDAANPAMAPWLTIKGL